MPSASQRGKREMEKFFQSILKQSVELENWGLGSYTREESSHPFGIEATLTLTLREIRPTGSRTSSPTGEAKGGRGTASGSPPGKQQRGGASRG